MQTSVRARAERRISHGRNYFGLLRTTSLLALEASSSSPTTSRPPRPDRPDSTLLHQSLCYRPLDSSIPRSDQQRHLTYSTVKSPYSHPSVIHPFPTRSAPLRLPHITLLRLIRHNLIWALPSPTKPCPQPSLELRPPFVLTVHHRHGLQRPLRDSRPSLPGSYRKTGSSRDTSSLALLSSRERSRTFLHARDHTHRDPPRFWSGRFSQSRTTGEGQSLSLATQRRGVFRQYGLVCGRRAAGIRLRRNHSAVR